MSSKFKIDISEFKRLYRKDQCSSCPKRLPCGALDSICELVTPCSICEVREKCTSLCEQMEAYLNRGVKGQPSTLPLDENADFSDEPESIRKQKRTFDDIPWEALPQQTQDIVIDHFKNNLTYSQIAKKYSISKGRAFKVVRGYGTKRKGAIDILKKYTEYQRLYTKYGKFVPRTFSEVLKSYFLEYKTIKEIAEEQNESERTIQIRFKKAKELIDKFK